MRHHSALAALVTGGALLATALAAPAAQAAAAPRATVVPCGAVLTTSVRLAADVVCPGGTGITLAADGIELNLNGHAVTGPGPARDLSVVGVAVRGEGVVVRNGTVRGWSSGVLAGYDPYGEDEQAPADALVRQTRLDGNGTGVEVRRAGDVTVRGSRFTGNGVGGSSVTDGRLLVESSTAEGNDGGFSSFEVDWDGLVVRDTTVRDSRGAAVSCSADGHAVVERSTLQRNGTGLDTFLCSARVTGSAFQWNRKHLAGWLVDFDRVTVDCTSFTRGGGPLTFAATACGSGGRVSGVVEPREPGV